jgi:hypothetical protein
MSALQARVAQLSPPQRELLASRLRRRRAEGRGPAIPARPDRAQAPLSYSQEGLWLLDQLEPGSPRFCLPGRLRVTGRLSRPALERAVWEIVRRHESLRTRFVVVDGQPVQQVEPFWEVPVEHVDLRGRPGEEREAEVERRSVEEALRPFDLAEGPVLRVALLQVADEEHVLLVTMHHIVSDGWSLVLFVRELAALSEALAREEAPALPELPIQFGDYAAWQRDARQDARFEEQLAYWKEQLAGIPGRLDLPLDHPRPPVQTYWAGHASVAVPPETAAGLKALAREEGATLFMALLAGFTGLLHLLSGQDDVTVGSPIAGRRWSETERLIGFFVNMLPLRTGCAGEPSFRELLRRVRATVLGAYAHQDLPFPRLVGALPLARDRSRAPVFQVVFILLDHMPDVAAGPDREAALRWSPLEIDKQTVKYDLILFMQESGAGLSAELLYNRDLLEARTAEQMLGLFPELLAQAVKGPDGRLSELRLGSAAEGTAGPPVPGPGPADEETFSFGGPDGGALRADAREP